VTYRNDLLELVILDGFLMIAGSIDATESNLSKASATKHSRVVLLLQFKYTIAQMSQDNWLHSVLLNSGGSESVEEANLRKMLWIYFCRDLGMEGLHPVLYASRAT
jgi:hypothetical protein